MKITVIAGSGFIGSHVSDILSNEGHKVKIFDKNRSKLTMFFGLRKKT